MARVSGENRVDALEIVSDIVSPDGETRDEGTWHKVALPGMATSDAFNRTHNIDVVAIVQYFECAGVTKFTHKDSFERHLTGKYTPMFLLIMNFEITPLVYKRARLGTCLSVDAVTTFVSFTKTGINMVTFLYDNSDGELLGKLKFKYVCISTETRRALTIPTHSKQRYKSYQKPAEICKDFKSKFVKKDQYVHVCKRIVKPSDLDWNYHVNNSVFITMCLDCAGDATAKGLFSHFPVNIASYHVRTLDMVYDRECQLGDVLSVLCWEDDEEPLRLHFEIKKDDGSLAVHSKMLFFPLKTAQI